MKYLKFLLLTISVLLFNVQAQESPLNAPDSGTFPVYEEQDKEKEMEIQEEEAEVDSFGEDEYNQNVDPDELKTNELYERPIQQDVE
ncbi:MAG: hypothetical protein H0V66_06165 [Bdellovibrionales bacterium]|nr:hypothetical protein [Bdellovibrionales bacterium]